MAEPAREPIGRSAQLEALSVAWSARGISSTHLVERPDGTLAASDRRLTVDSATLGLALEKTRVHGGPTDEPLEVGAQIGRGGMGVVHGARQEALRRDVAIKRRIDEDTPLDALLKEAWVAASLEHPNVVPVHVLARVGAEPAVVMKRIEGVSWSKVIRDPSLVPAADRADPYGWHVRILIQVCDAIALAHRRGILHLDLKPDNVMIGTFGEVHVLDWGLAAGWGEAAPEWLARAGDLRAVAGTPDYMAPELALGAGDRISPRTDVYLLGAILHEILTGQPPHHAEHMIGRLYLAFQSEPKEYGPDVSSSLAALLHRAMHKDPDQRHADVRALRAALEEHLASRAADDLLREALAQLDALRTEAAAEHPDELEVWRRFGACRFALREAGDGRRDHPEIAALRAALFEEMARWAIGAGRLELARTYLDELGEKPAELEARLEALHASAAERAAHVRALEAMAHEESLTVGSRFRSRLALVLGTMFLGANVAMRIAELRGLVTWGYPQLLVVGAGSFLLLAPYTWLRRRLIFRNRANAVFFAVCITTYFAVESYWIGMWALGVPVDVAFPLSAVFYFLAFGSVAVLLSARFAPSAIVQIPTVLAAARWPEHALEIIGIGGGISAALIGATWRDEPEEAAR